MSGLKVVCFLWGDPKWRRSDLYSYGVKHVQILQSMVRRHLTVPHEFICVTDETIEGVNTVPIDWRTHVPGTCYVRLMLWRHDIANTLGDRILAIDLDSVVTGSLDPIVSRKEDVVFWRNPSARPGSKRAPYNGSMLLLRAGAWPHVVEMFDPEKTPALTRQFTGDDQAWYSHLLPDEAVWTHEDGVYRAGSCAEKGVVGVDDVLPDDARIVFFPGKRDPHLAETQAKHPWILEHLH